MSRIQTLNDIYARVATRDLDPDAFRYKEDGAYRSQSNQEFARIGTEIALGLVSLGLKAGDKVAILSETRLAWAQADMGILTAGLVSVPIYPTLPASTVEYILGDSGARVLLVSNREQAEKVRGFSGRGAGQAFPVVVFDGEVESEGGGPTSLADLRERGRKLGRAEPALHQRRLSAVGPDDVATLIYTSGTTGPPKGVMLTHANIVSNVLAGLEVIPIHRDDTCLSFLPLSHVLERMAGLYVMLYAGATIAYAESLDTVPENLREVRPTVMVSVPRFYEKMYARVLDAAMQGGALKKNLFFWARRVGLAWTARRISEKPGGFGLELKYRAAKALVFSKLRERTGGRLRFFISGGAPLSGEIAEFFLAAGMPILEGYGLTETSPVLAVNPLEAVRPGTVGKPLPGVEIQIAADGEILARGPNVMKGYHNLPEATAEALVDGWFHTGDIGHLDEKGYLVITDRKKDIIVTAGGKNVAPQVIENLLKTDKYMSEVVVIGDRRPYLVALVVPNFKNLRSWARSRNLLFEDDADLVGKPESAEFVLERIALLQKDAASFEKIGKVHVLHRELVIGDELTPTLKVKRKEIGKIFHDEIEMLYSE